MFTNCRHHISRDGADKDDEVDVANSTDDNVSGFNTIDDVDNDLPAGRMKIRMNIP